MSPDCRRILLLALLLFGASRSGRGGGEALGTPPLVPGRAQSALDLGDVDGGQRIMADLLAAIPGRVDEAAALLGAMGTVSMRDGRPDHWTDYAAERLVALHRAELVDDGAAGLKGAYESLAMCRWAQGRTLEAWDAIQFRRNLLTRRGLPPAGEIPGFEAVETFLSRVRPGEARDRHVLRGADMAERSRARPLQRVAVVTEDVDQTSNQRWSGLLTRRPDTEPAFFDQCIRTACAIDQEWVSCDDHGQMDLWWAVDLLLGDMDGAAMAGLRQIQEIQYERQANLPRQESREQRSVTALYRASPWSSTANADLLAFAQTELNRGHTASALRSFLDVMHHSVDAPMRQAAQVGIWLTAASSGTASELAAMFEGIDTSARFPWLGKFETAANIKARLLKGMPADAGGGARLVDLNLIHMRLPAVSPWPAGAVVSLQPAAALVDLQMCGDRILAGGRSWLAWYDASNPMTPLWTAVEEGLLPSPVYRNQFVGYWRPAFVNSRLYARTGAWSVPSEVRAISTESGRSIWETAATPPQPLPVNKRTVFNIVQSDPLVAGGCVYYVQCVGSKTDGGDARLEVVCMDADAGKPAWRSTVVSADDDTPVAREFRNGWSAVSVWGNAPTLAGGALYLNSAGVAARLDARDGRVEWLCTSRSSPAPKQTTLASSEPLGASPLVAGGQVVLVPRDGGSLFAVDTRTGKRMWEQVLVQPVEILGVHNDLVVVRTMSELMGVAVDSGAIRWHRPAPEDVVGRCSLHHGVVTMASTDSVFRINAADGALRERRAWPTGGKVWNYAIVDETLVVVGDETAPTPSYSPGMTLAAEGTPETNALSSAFSRAWFLPVEDARVFAPSATSPLHGRIFVVSDGMLEAIDVAVPGRSVWRRFTAGSVDRILFEDATMVLCSGAVATMAVDGRSGLTLCRFPPVKDAREVFLTGGVVLMRGHPDDVRAYDAQTGGLLWVRQGFRSPMMHRPGFMAFAEHGQFHLFGEKWEPGIPDLRMDARSGVMLPLRWAVDRVETLLGRRSIIAMGKDAALIRVWDRSDPKRHRAGVHRYSLGDGTSREIDGMATIHTVAPPYALLGEEHGPARLLLSLDDPSYEYAFNDPGGLGLSGGLMTSPRGKKISVFDPKRRRQVFELDLEKTPLDGPGVVRLNDAGMVLYGVNGDRMEFREVDMDSGRVIRESSLSCLDANGRGPLGGQPLVVDNMMIFSCKQGLQAVAVSAE